MLTAVWTRHAGFNDERVQALPEMAKHAAPIIESSGSNISFLREAFTAQDRSPLSRAERHRGFLATLRTYRAGFNTREMMCIPERLRVGKNGHALGLAVFAALRFVFEVLVAEKDLFPSSKNELGPAVDAGQYLILEFH